MSTDTTPDDNQIPFDLAARALRCSRRTVERMIERGQLERADGAPVASVTRQSLARLIDGKNIETPELTRQSAAGAPIDGAALIAVFDQIREANERALEAIRESSDLRVQLRQIEAAEADRVRVIDERDQLIERLVNGSRRERRAARRLARSRS